MSHFGLFFLSFFLFESEHHCHAIETMQLRIMENRNIIGDATTRGRSFQQFARKSIVTTNHDSDGGGITKETVHSILPNAFVHFKKRISKLFSVNNNFIAYRKTILHTSQDVFWRDSNGLFKHKARGKRNTKTTAKIVSSHKQSRNKMAETIAPTALHSVLLEPTLTNMNVSSGSGNTSVSSSRNITYKKTELQITWNRGEQTTNATVCLSVLLFLLLFIVYRSKMWREIDEYWYYLAAPDSRFNLDDDWTYNRHNRPRLNVNLKEMLKSKVQALQTLFRKSKAQRRQGREYTRLSSIDEHDSEEVELFTQPV